MLSLGTSKQGSCHLIATASIEIILPIHVAFSKVRHAIVLLLSIVSQPEFSQTSSAFKLRKCAVAFSDNSGAQVVIKRLQL